MVERFLRLTDVCEKTSLPRSTIYEMMAENRFPKAFPITPRRVAWRESEIAAWQQDRLREAGRLEEAA